MGDGNVRYVSKCELETTLCSDAIYTPYRTFRPDSSKAYLEARFSHAFPAVMAFGNALHPQTVANSFNTMWDQVVNIEHTVRSYDPDKISRDKIVGSVCYVEFPQLPADKNAWTINTKEDPPHIRAVLSIGKQAAGVDKLLGKHQSGRKKWSVSMEYQYDPSQSGFLIPNTIRNASGLLQMQDTPNDVRDAGYYYVHMSKAPADLIDCWQDGHMAKKWRDVMPIMLQGGVGGSIHYFGIGLTENPAEPGAEITKMLASKDSKDKPSNVDTMLHPVKGVLECVKNYLTKQQ